MGGGETMLWGLKLNRRVSRGVDNSSRLLSGLLESESSEGLLKGMASLTRRWLGYPRPGNGKQSQKDGGGLLGGNQSPRQSKESGKPS